MKKKELMKLHKAIKNMKTENDTFMVEGELFFCRWTGHSFTWVVNGRTYENCTVKEVLSFIGNGEYIINYCYDYNNESEV